MGAETLLRDLLACGIDPEVTDDGEHISVPIGCLTAQQREAIRDNKLELITCIQEAARITAELMAAAMRCCDQMGDSPQAREQMRLEILETRPEHRKGLLQHFESEYPKPGQIT